MLRLGAVLTIAVLALSGCCSSRSSSRDAAKCRSIRESEEAARRGWRNAHSPGGFVEVERTLHGRMYVAQVRTKLGAPAAVDSMEGHLVWTYVADEDSMHVRFRDGVVVGWERQNEGATEE